MDTSLTGLAEVLDTLLVQGARLSEDSEIARDLVVPALLDDSTRRSSSENLFGKHHNSGIQYINHQGRTTFFPQQEGRRE